MANTDQAKINELLSRGVEKVYPTSEALKEKLASGHKIRVYLGIDPTAPSLHIGHAVQLKKLAEFQALGHEVIMLIGSFTAMIGDPTDKLAARQQLSASQVMENAATYKKQAKTILKFTGPNGAKIMFNHKWLSKMNLSDALDLASHFTVQQMSERDMFEKRLAEGKPVHLHEFMYPLLQGYDSVAMDVDLEIGGSDQTFNMLAGRTLMKEIKNKEKMVLTLKLLTNDAGQKMSKSEGGFIAITDEPEDMYGKIMSMADSMILPYFELVTDVPMEEIEGMKLQMNAGTNPRDLKMRLAEEVVTKFHSAAAAKRAAKHFSTVFQAHEQPADMSELKVSSPKNILDVLVEAKLATSRSEAKQLIAGGGVRLGDKVVSDPGMNVDSSQLPQVLQKGKRHFVRLVG